MKVNIYVSDSGSPAPRYGFLPPDRPMTLLPRGEKWTYVWSADTKDFHLPEAVEEEIERRGFWAHGSPHGDAERTPMPQPAGNRRRAARRE